VNIFIVFSMRSGLLLLGSAASVSGGISCAVRTPPLGCFVDAAESRAFAYQALDSDAELTQEKCAVACFSETLLAGGGVANFSAAAVEFGSQCFCATPGELRRATPAPGGLGDCEGKMSCGGGNKTESCGDADRALALAFDCTGSLPPQQPNYQACISDVAKALPYCDPALSLDTRVDDLLGRLTLDEQIAAISPQPKLGETCGDHTAGKPAIGLPDYFWLVEANTNVAAKCHPAQWKCPTTVR
jgi:hypothetical protein